LSPDSALHRRIGASSSRHKTASNPLPFGRHLLLPARGFLHTWYSSVLPYRNSTGLVVFGAQPTWRGDAEDDPHAIKAGGQQPPEWTVVAASPLGKWIPLARVKLLRSLPEHDARTLRFNPTNSGGGIRPTGALNALRDAAYRKSQFTRRSSAPGATVRAPSRTKRTQRKRP
jgi:hypothetical protein